MRRRTSCIALGIALVAVACGGKTSSDTPPTPGIGVNDETPSDTPDPNAINVGVVLSLSGPDAVLGTPSLQAAQLAAEQLNALGGIRGKRIKLLVHDDRSEPSETRAAIDRLASQGVVLGVGPTTSTQAAAALDFFRSGRVLYVSPTAGSSILDVPDAHPESYTPTILFRARLPDSYLATAVAQHATGPVESGARRCSAATIVVEDDAESRAFAERIVFLYKRLSLRIEGPMLLPPAASTASVMAVARAVIGKLAVDRQCHIVITGTRTTAAYARAVERATAELGLASNTFTTIATGLGVSSASVIAEARQNPAAPTSPSSIEGWTLVLPDLTPRTPEHAAFASAWTAKYPDTAPDGTASAAYDATLLLALATARTTSTEVAPLGDALFAISQGRLRQGPTDLVKLVDAAVRGDDVDYEGASGMMNFALNGGYTPNDVLLFAVENGTPVPKGKFESSHLGDE